MAIIVKHNNTGNYYALVGTGTNIDPSLLSPRFLKNLLPLMVTVCDRNGNIFGLPASEVIVTTIDSQSPGELLPEPDVITPTVSPESEVNATNAQGEGEIFDDDEDEDWI
ncbi:MAG TPA: hypothetical protein DCF68_04630 [Cyanothece sp. UBA12306]|nr:hypothetical protein [Cyanothece sp. UBA12306]